MYLTFHNLKEKPFHLTPNTDFFYGLAPHYEAIRITLDALALNEGVVKITGEVGTGKTLVCRVLMNQLSAHKNIQLIYLPTPDLTPDQLRVAIAHELNIRKINPTNVVTQIQNKLIALHKKSIKVITLVDEAQALSDESIEALRLLSNLETNTHKLLQLVLIGQPELDSRLEEKKLRQLRQRIGFSAKLRGLNLNEASAYIEHRMLVSGAKAHFFSKYQKKMIWKASNGIPRLIHHICNKTLLLSYVKKMKIIRNTEIISAIKDTAEARKPLVCRPFCFGWRLS